ncbi:molybdenum cofactor guanylyltransferase MobA [Taklimakanibacter deserti]|uniref:molybdenum cofactor guanylyltransferase MobA n=1 Tax=Taklimakanibacter deserti TaxID=2267839 RepID=UPI000E65ABF9
MSVPTSIAGCILAGGQSRRMGEDKARLLLGETPLITHAIARLAPQVAQLIVNRHDGTQPIDTQGLPVVTDAPGDHLGPLAGLLAALDWAGRHDFAFVATAAVDTPFFPRDLVPKLVAAAQGLDMAVASSDGRLHPVFGLWKVTLVPVLLDFMQGSRRSMNDWAMSQGAGIAEWTSLPYDPFFNINTPEDMDMALRLRAEYRP